MTSKNFSSKGLLGDSLRRNLWGFVLGGVGFFLSLLLPALMIMQRALECRTRQMQEFPDLVNGDWESALNTVAAVIGGDNVFAKAVFVVLAIVCGIAMFAYLHSRQKVDFYHSLPISRTRLFVNNYLTGVILAVSTYLVMLAITFACVYAMGFGEAVDWGAIGGAVLCNLIVFLVVYALTVLTTVVCGNTIITLLLLAWVMLSPMLVRLLFDGLCGRFYESYAGRTVKALEAVRLSPVVQYFAIDGLHYKSSNFLVSEQKPEFVVGLLVIYLLVALAVTVLSWYLFRIRRSERSGTALAFTPAKLPIKVYMCLTIGVAFGLVFGMIAGDFWFWIGLVIGTVLFHWIVEIIYAFDFRAIFAKPVHLAAILVVLFAALLCMKFDVTGYDSWLPDRDDIQAVSVDGDANAQMTESANIDAVYRLAEIGTQVNRDALRDGVNRYMTLGFQLGGRTVLRYYVLPEDAEVQALCNQIYASEEYKRTSWPLFQIDPEKIGTEYDVYLDIFTNAYGYESVDSVWDSDAIKQILGALREESLARKENSLPVMRVQIFKTGADHMQRYVGNAYVTAEDEKTLALFKELTGIMPQAIQAKDVAAATIEYSMQGADGEYQSEIVKITDSGDIELLLKNAINNAAMSLGYAGDAMEYGFALDARCDNISVTVQLGEENTGDCCWLVYPDGMWPEAVVEKYRPDGNPDDSNVVGGEVVMETAG